MNADIRAGLVVFLIALPLSLGISLASGAPPTAGLVSAILGGLIGAYLGGSQLTINGPAAGLIVVVLSAIHTLGADSPLLGFRRMLACVVVVGILQIISGLLKAGRFTSLFPLAVVHGMLASIGLIIMIKQIHVFLGVNVEGGVIEAILAIPQSLQHLQVESTGIGLLSLFILLGYPYYKLNWARFVPAPLVVIVVSIITSYYWGNVTLVEIPTSFADFYVAPLFDVITSYESLMAIASLYFVASLESVLSASAVDKLDPLQRESDFDRELWSKGIVNLCCGLLGGLPIIAEIVRSSASISQGAQSKLANFSHSAFMLLFLLLFPGLLNSIPLSALAAILILVGYGLARPRQFRDMFTLGTGSFLSFMTTILFTLFFDLLVGIFMGIVVNALNSLLQGASFKHLLTPHYRLRHVGDKAILEFEGSLVFFSVLKQKKILSELNAYKEVEIDLNKIKFMDPTSLSVLTRESNRMKKAGLIVNLRLPERFSKAYQVIKSR